MSKRGSMAWLLAWPGALAAQATLADYARVTALVNYMTSYVGETLLACAAAKTLTEQQAEARFTAYQQRNTALLERAERWRESAARRLAEQGASAAARSRSDDEGLTAMAAASARVQEEVGRQRDVPAFCAAQLAAIGYGGFDISSNAELQELLAK